MLVNIGRVVLWATFCSALDLEAWFQQSKGPLTSDQLFDLVPLNDNPGYGIDRFSVWGFLRLLFGQNAPVEPAPSFNLDEFVASHGSDAESNFKYGEMLFYGVNGYRNLSRAMSFYELAAADGHAEGQFMVGLAYSTGLFGHYEVNEGLATLYYTFAAINDSVRGKIAVGYRYLHGVDSPRDIEQAYEYLDSAADDCHEANNNSPGLGPTPDPNLLYIIADEYDSGLYGIKNENVLLRSAAREVLREFSSIQEGMEKLMFSADEGGTTAAFKWLAYAYSFGADHPKANYKEMVKCCRMILERTQNDQSPGAIDLRTWALSCIGMRYLRGEGVPLDLESGRKYLTEALEVANAHKDLDPIKNCELCYRGLGLLALHESNQATDNLDEMSRLYELSNSYFQQGALIGDPLCQYYVGLNLYEKGHLVEAADLFKKCRAFIPDGAYYLGKTYSARAANARSEKFGSELRASAATEMYRCCKNSKELYSPVRWAQKVYEKDQDASLVGLLVMAELGSTSAQINVADILDVSHSTLSEKYVRPWPIPSYVKEEGRAPLCLKYFDLSGQLLGGESLYKAADYYYYGIGTASDPHCAAEIYRALVRDYNYPMADWALGWMHEHGDAVTQDYHVAKRHYDNALLSGQRASIPYIPVKLSLVVLYVKQLIARWSGQKLTDAATEYMAPAPAKKSWGEQLSEARRKIDAFRRLDALEGFDEEGGIEEDYDPDTLFVDLTIISVIFVVFAILVWFRRRNNNNNVNVR